MTAWIYICSERPCADNGYNALYTVGFYQPDGKFNPVSDHHDVKIAEQRVHYLNGGKEAGDASGQA